MSKVDRMSDIEHKLIGHGGIYDALGQVATILGTGHGDQKTLGARVDAVRDAVEAVAQQHAGAVTALRRIRDHANSADDPAMIAQRALTELGDTSR